MRFRKLTALTCSLALVALALPVGALASPTVTVSGSTSIFPLAVQLAKGYLKQHPHSITFRILQGGSDVGIDDVAHGRVTIGDASRDPLPSDPGGLVFNRIARDAVCVVTNRGNPVTNLSQGEIQSIFDGSHRSWSGISGQRVGGTIDLITRTAASGTHDAFQNIFMNPYNISGSASQKSSNGLVQQAVKNDRHAIGYVSLDFSSGLHPVPFEDVQCSLRKAKSGEYGGVRNFWMVTRGKPSGAAGTWIHWIRSNGAANRIIGTHWVGLH